MVQPDAPGPFSVSPVRALERGIAVGTRLLSGRLRLESGDEGTGVPVVGELCRVCPAVRRLCRERRPACPAGDGPDPRGSSTKTCQRAAPPAFGTKLLWFGLAMVPSVLLLATTNQVCLDVASVPFLWVLPLTLYLLSFILCFDSDWWYSRKIMMPAAVLALVALYPVLRTGATASFAVQLLAYFIAFFLCAMVCHGELVRRKPDARASDRILPGDRGGRRRRRNLRRHHCPPGLQQLLRVASGTFRRRGADVGRRRHRQTELVLSRASAACLARSARGFERLRRGPGGRSPAERRLSRRDQADVLRRAPRHRARKNTTSRTNRSCGS